MSRTSIVGAHGRRLATDSRGRRGHGRQWRVSKAVYFRAEPAVWPMRSDGYLKSDGGGEGVSGGHKRRLGESLKKTGGGK